MPCLSELPELVGFFSYSREDDTSSENNVLTTLRRRIQSELRSQLGRSEQTLRLWQDGEAIPPGTLWESEIEAAVSQSVFFIPIITPRVVASKYCAAELQRFLDRETALSRSDLVFPILYIDVKELRNETLWRKHDVLKTIGARQYVDWRDYRFEPNSVASQRAIASLCAKIGATLDLPASAPRPADRETVVVASKITPEVEQQSIQLPSPTPADRPSRPSDKTPPASQTDQTPSRPVPMDAPSETQPHIEDEPPPTKSSSSPSAQPAMLEPQPDDQWSLPPLTARVVFVIYFISFFSNILTILFDSSILGFATTLSMIISSTIIFLLAGSALNYFHNIKYYLKIIFIFAFIFQVCVSISNLNDHEQWSNGDYYRSTLSFLKACCCAWVLVVVFRRGQAAR